MVFPFAETVVVKGSDVSAAFAVSELNFIVSNATGRAFEDEGMKGCKDEGMRGCKDASSHRIFVGRSPAAEKILGAAFFDKLQNEESVVMAKGDDLFLVGGGQLGALYAVYDFVEDNLGFRHYFFWDDGFVVDKVKEVSFGGKATRRRPAFRGFRKCHHDDWRVGLFETRNRMNTRTCEHIVRGYRNPLSGRIPGHGFNLLLPADEPTERGWGPLLKEVGIHGEFDRHPEWFSLGEDGKRHKDMQLCLSNSGCREKLLENLILWIRNRGPGVYMVGSNDNHNTRYCNCTDCIAKEKKYASVGGPLWDWILWACPELERRGYKDALVTSLAYKGWRQTERAPAGVERFPDNFICDAAFLNCDRELAAVFDERLPDGTVYNKLENLKRWCRLCRHVSYWYYGGTNPAQVYVRMQRELRELHDAGVESVGTCGPGGMYEFGDFEEWIFARLARDPYCDLEPDLRRIFRIKYGPAAEKVRAYVDYLDGCRRKAVQTLAGTTTTDDPYDGFSYLEGGDLVAMWRLMDDALALAKGTEYEMNVKAARIGLNIFMVTYLHKVRAVDPDFAARYDYATCEAEVREATEHVFRRHFADKRFAGLMKYLRDKHSPERYMVDMANYANLRDDSLPKELSGCPREKVYRILPPKSMPYYCGNEITGKTSERDERAVSGWAWSGELPAKSDPLKDGFLSYEAYDSAGHAWIRTGQRNRIPLSAFRKGEYALVKLGVMPIPSSLMFVFAGGWSSPTVIRQCGRLFDCSYVNRQWEVWASVKGDGPKFFADADPDAESRLWIEQLFCVDRGVPEGK